MFSYLIIGWLNIFFFQIMILFGKPSMIISKFQLESAGLTIFLLGLVNREFRRLFVIGVWNLFEALFYCNWKFLFRGFVIFYIRYYGIINLYVYIL